MTNKYSREIKPGVHVDVYDVLKAFNVTCPAMAHAIKKCLAPGQRGVKSTSTDKHEAVASIQRSIEMDGQRYDVTGPCDCAPLYHEHESNDAYRCSQCGDRWHTDTEPSKGEQPAEIGDPCDCDADAYSCEGASHCSKCGATWVTAD